MNIYRTKEPEKVAMFIIKNAGECGYTIEDLEAIIWHLEALTNAIKENALKKAAVRDYVSYAASFLKHT